MSPAALPALTVTAPLFEPVGVALGLLVEPEAGVLPLVPEGDDGEEP